MGSYPPIQSVQRAVELLTALNEQKVNSVDQLHRRTGLPKPTLVRLLQTFVGLGLVMNDRRQGGYTVTSKVQLLSRGFHGDPLVIEAGRAWAIDLTRRHKWPVSIAMLERDEVVVRFSTIPDSPISPFHVSIHMRLSLIGRGLGRAYLAFCPSAERRILLDALALSDRAEDALARDRVAVLRMLAAIRKRGHAERDPHVEPRDSNTLAVPIMHNDRVLATLGVTCFASALRPEGARGVLVAELRTAAERIAEDIAALESGAKLLPRGAAQG